MYGSVWGAFFALPALPAKRIAVFLWAIWCLVLPGAADAEARYTLTGRAELTPQEAAAWSFLHHRMLDDSGLIHYLVSNRKKSPGSVMESSGQAMEYLAMTGDAVLFAWYAEIAERYFRDKEGYYYWEVAVKSKKGKRVTALVDDLRLFKAYRIAHEKGMGDYIGELRDLAESVYDYDVNEQGYAVSYNNRDDDDLDIGVNLYYLDVETMDQMAEYDVRWRETSQKGKRILLGMPKNEHGFYPAKYEIEANRYVVNPEINMIENLYTAFFAMHAGYDVKPFVDFLKARAAAGRIYNIYRLDGTPSDARNEATAVEALAARFLYANGEFAAAEVFYEKMLRSQIAPGSKSVGGFSKTDDETVYAFDQLEALLVMRVVTFGEKR